jgi:hypothetical protein
VIASAERSTAPASQREQRPSFSYETPDAGQKHAAAARTRQHSEPPLNRTMFPPTPPPDASKASTSSSSGSLGRPGSLKAARPPRLDLDRPGANITSRRAKPDSESPEKPRIGTTRTASEPRGPAQQQHGQFDRDICPQHPHGRMGHRRGLSDTGYAGGAERAYADEPQGVYNSARTMGMAADANGVRKPVPQLRQRERYIDEDEEYHHCHGQYPNYGDPFHASAGGGGDFEPVGTKRRTGSPTRETAAARRDVPDVRKFRVKVHAPEDTRYIIVGPGIGFGEFEARIREKFGFRLRLRIRMQDDGDMITMVDQEDLDLLVGAARENAGREGSGMGKMEVSLILLPVVWDWTELTVVDLGGRTAYDLGRLLWLFMMYSILYSRTNEDMCLYAGGFQSSDNSPSSSLLQTHDRNRKPPPEHQPWRRQYREMP